VGCSIMSLSVVRWMYPGEGWFPLSLLGHHLAKDIAALPGSKLGLYGTTFPMSLTPSDSP
jgi:hypothetical protein